MVTGRDSQTEGRNMGYFPVRYNYRVVIYERKMFIRLATEVSYVQPGAMLCAHVKK